MPKCLSSAQLATLSGCCHHTDLSETGSDTTTLVLVGLCLKALTLNKVSHRKQAQKKPSGFPSGSC